MDDLISRQAAIDALTTEYMAVGILGEQWAISQCIDAIKKLPSAHPEQKRGRLVKYKNWYSCSECGTEMFFSGTYDKSQHYCYNCGAKMEGET